MRSALRLVAALGLCAAGCQPQSPAGPSWSTPVTGLAPILLSTWGTGPDDVWAVGGTCNPSSCAATSASLVLHFDGHVWSERKVPVTSVLWWVYGFATNDVYISGESGTLLHYDGSSFTRMAVGLAPKDKLFGIWGPSTNDLWAVGGQPDQSSTVLRYDGNVWRPDGSVPQVTDGTAAAFGGTWFKVWGSAKDDVWLCGQRGNLLHYDGTSFVKTDLSALGVSAQGLFTVAGRAANDVWVVGGDSLGLALHFDGAAWARAPGLDTSSAPLLTGVFELPAGDVAITGLGGAKFVGRAGSFSDQSTSGTTSDLHAVWMAAPDDAFAVGGDFYGLRDGVVAHYGDAIPGTLQTD